MNNVQPPRPVGPLRPAVRARLLWRVVRRQHQGRRQPRAGAHRPRRPHQPRPPRRHRRRGRHRRRRRHPHPGPRPLPARGVRRSGSTSRPPGRYAVGHGVPADRRRRRREGQGGDRGHRRRRGPRRRRLARRAGRPGVPRRHRPGGDADVPPAVRHRRRCRPGDAGIDLDRKVFVARKRVEHELAPELATYFPSLSARTLVYKGMLTTPQLGRVLPRPRRRALRERHRCSCTAASRPTRSRRGRSPTRTASSPTTARSTRCRATRTGCAPARRWSTARTLAGARAGVPDLHAGRVRHRPLRRGARAAPPRRPPAPPRRADDDPRGVGEQRHDGPGGAGVLPLPLHGDGAVGRPGQRRLHRRHGDRRRARPQRPAPEPLLGHRRRPRRDGVGGRRDRHRPGQGRAARAGSSRAGCSSSTPPPGRIVDDDEIKRRSPPSTRTASGSTRASSSSTTCPPASTSCSATTACCAASSCSATPTRSSRSSSPRWRRRGPSRSARWAPTRRSPCCRSVRACCSTTSSSCSPRSPTRRSTRSARRSSRRWRRRSGRRANLLRPGPESCRQLVLPFPIIDNDELAKIIHANDDGAYPGLQARTWSRACYRVAGGGLALERALDGDLPRGVGGDRGRRSRSSCSPTATPTHVEAPIPSLLLTAAVHHHLVRTKQRTKVGLVVECGDAREVHHMALLIGYGAGAINPYLAFESIEDMIADDGGMGQRPRRDRPAQGGAQLHQGVRQGRAQGDVEDGRVDGGQLHRRPDLRGDRARRASSSTQYFTGTVSRLGGIGLDEIAAEVAARHAVAHPTRPEERAHRTLELGGEYQWRREGEFHLFNPETVFKLQHATRAKRYDIFKEYSRRRRRPVEAAGHAARPVRVQGRRARAGADRRGRAGRHSIVRRFSTGAMSYGSISPRPTRRWPSR